MASIALTELSAPLVAAEECRDVCYVCLEPCAEGGAFKCVNGHPVCINSINQCLRKMIANLKPSQELMCGLCRNPMPEAVVHAGSLSERAELLNAYRQEAIENFAREELGDPDHLGNDVEERPEYQEIVITFRVDPALEEEDRRCQRRSLCAMAGLVLGGIGIIFGLAHQKGLI